MNNQLVEYKIESAIFLVDIPQMCLVEKDNPENYLSVLAMTDKRTHYEFDYDLENRTLIPDHYLPPEGTETIHVRIPQLKELDPESACAFFGKSKDELAQMCDYELMFGKDPYTARVKNGVLPVVDIADHPFFVDLRMGVLRPKDDFTAGGIDISYVDPKACYHPFFYHIPSHSEYFPYAGLTELPEDVVKAIIPGPLRLDPVASAVKEGKPDDHYLKDIPLNLYHKAMVIPPEMTELAELVKAERQFVRLKQQQQLPQTRKAVQRKNKGKKL